MNFFSEFHVHDEKMLKFLEMQTKIAKFGVDTAENEPLQIWAPIQFIIQFPP